MSSLKTPKMHHDNLRRSVLMSSAVSSPLRRSLGTLLNNDSTPTLSSIDEEQERSNRRSLVTIQRRLTNVASPATPGGSVVLETTKLKDNLKVYSKLYAENKINAKNAWQLHVIDVMAKMTTGRNPNIIQEAGSSLDIGAKVYSLRVDDVHTRGIQLSCTSGAGSKKKKGTNSEGDGEDQAEDLINEDAGARRKTKKMKAKKLCADKRNTIVSDDKMLFGPIKHVESMVFGTKENIEISAIDHLFTNKLMVEPGSHDFMLLSGEKCWTRNPDAVLKDTEQILDIEMPNITTYSLCVPFKEFTIGNWDPEEEERLLGQAPCNGTEIVIDDDGLPVPELDGSIHDVFANDDVFTAEDHTSEPEDNNQNDQLQDRFQAQIQPLEPIVDGLPHDHLRETEYGYNTLIAGANGKYIDKIWAGPSHWKVKFIRRSAARFSGAVTQHVTKHTKKRVKQPVSIDYFNIDDYEDLDNLPKYVAKRGAPTSVLHKVTLPIPEVALTLENFHKLTDRLFQKPSMLRPRLQRLRTVPKKDGEGQNFDYDYNNPNDSLYCSQHNINDEDNNDDGPLQHSIEEEFPAAAQVQFTEDNLVNAPEMVAKVQMSYAMKAKKMDMKKLKSIMWKNLTVHNPNNNCDDVKPTMFSGLYTNLPSSLSVDMRKELTCPLAFVALLHLCNENNLQLKGSSANDFLITGG